MSTLAGRASYGRTLGQITLNGTVDSLLKYPKLVGFVPQEDVMHRDCTVLEVREEQSIQQREQCLIPLVSSLLHLIPHARI